LYLVYGHLPDYREHTDPLDVAGLLLFGSGVALLSYVLEVFGEHTLNTHKVLELLALSILLLAGYGFHATRTSHPMLRLILFRIRTFRAAVSGGFLTRLGIGGVPFLFPLLYQVGLGLTPVQSGLLMMPQAIAAKIQTCRSASTFKSTAECLVPLSLHARTGRAMTPISYRLFTAGIIARSW
jgi:hypothetical protein